MQVFVRTQLEGVLPVVLHLARRHQLLVARVELAHVHIQLGLRHSLMETTDFPALLAGVHTELGGDPVLVRSMRV